MSMGSQPVAMLAGKHLRDYALTPLMIRIWYGKGFFVKFRAVKLSKFGRF